MSKDYGPFEDLASTSGAPEKDASYGPFDDLAKAGQSAAQPAESAKPYVRPPTQAKSLSLGGIVNEAKGLVKTAADTVGRIYSGNPTDASTDAEASDAMGSGVGQAITGVAGPERVSLGQQLQQPAPADLPVTLANARGNAVWDSMSPKAQERARTSRAIQESRASAPDLKAAPDRGALQTALDTTNRKPLDNSLGGAALETLGDAARGSVRGIEGLAGAGWSGIRAASDLTLGSDSDLSSVAANASQAASDAQRSIASRDPNSVTQQVFESTFANVPIMLGFGTGWKALGAMGGISASQSYNEARNQGKAPDEAAERALWQGTAEILGERLSLPIIGEMFSKAAGKASTQELGKLLSELLVKEQVGEQATTALQSAYDKVGRGGTRPDMTLDDYLNDVVDTAKVTLGQSLLMGGGAGIVKGVADAAEGKPPKPMSAVELARSHGFLITPPTAEDTPTVQRDRYAGVFRDLGAHFGLPKKAVERAIESSDGVPIAALGDRFKRIAAAYQKRGLFGAQIDPEVMGVFDGPVQVSTEDATGLADEPAAAAVEAQVPEAASPVSNLPEIEQQESAQQTGGAQTGDGAPGLGEQAGGVSGTERPADTQADGVKGEPIDAEWSAFTKESGTLGIPRAEMPQVKAEHRGAMVNFLNARGIEHERDEVPASSLKPSQAEFSPPKVDKAKAFTEGDRSILVSQDGHVVDGHHQWLAKLDAGEPVKVIRLKAPAAKVIEEVKAFPSSEQAPGASASANTAKPPKARKHPPVVRGSGAMADVSRALGGISPDLLADLSEKVVRNRASKSGKKTQYTAWDNPAIPGVGPLFRKGGTADLSEVARVLEESGYLEAGAVENDPVGAAQRAQEIIKAELRQGGSTLQVGNADAIESEVRSRQEAAMDEMSDPWDDFTFTPDDLDEVGFTDANETTRALTEQLIAEADGLGIDTESIRDDVARQVGEEASQDEYHAAAQEAIRQAVAKTRQDAERGDTGPARAGDQDGGSPVEQAGPEGSRSQGRQGGSDQTEGLSLTAPTRADIEAQQDRAEQGDQLDQREQIRKESEAGAGGFELTTQEGRQDNTGDLFSQQSGSAFSLSAESPVFVSELTEQVKRSPMNAGTAGAWQQYLDALAKRGAIKADEVEWTGLREWLTIQPGKITKAKISEFLDANGVQVQEVELAPEESGMDMDDWLETWAEGRDGPTAEAIQGGDTWDNIREAARKEGQSEVLRRLDAKVLPSKFERWTVPGGRNYREVLLTLPVKSTGPIDLVWRQNDSGKWAWFSNGKQVSGAFPSADYQESARIGISSAAAPAGVYKSSHWDQPNVIAHVRVDDRTDADGKRVLFVQEVQSDWGQDGKRKGFGGIAPKASDAIAYLKTKGVTDPEDEFGYSNPADYVDVAINRFGWRPSSGSGVPSAPFVTKTDAWVGLAIKRIIKMASDGGYDRVAFINGQQAADLFDLSKQVDQIRYIKRSDGRFDVWAADAQGSALNDTVDKQGLSLPEVESFVGKDVAEKIARGDGRQDDGDMVLSGLDLKVGGEGMRTFYDQIVPKVAKEVLKKVGGGGMSAINLAPRGTVARHNGGLPGFGIREADGVVRGQWDTASAAQADLEQSQTGFDITPAMREKAAGGLPLFSREDTPSLSSLGIVPIGGSIEGSVSGGIPGDVNAINSLDERAISKVDLERVIDNLQDGWRGLVGGQIVAVDSWRDLPERIVQNALSSRTNLGRIEGVVDQGVAYIVRSAIRSQEHAERVVFHEVYGHLGLKGALGGGPEARLNALWSSMNGLAGVAKLAKKYDAQAGKTVWDRLQPYIRGTEGKSMEVRRSTIMNELIAFLAQANDTSALTQFKGYLSDLKTAVVKLLRKLNLTTLADKLDRAGTELDVLALVRDSRKAIITGKTSAGEPFVFVNGSKGFGQAQAQAFSNEGGGQFSIQPDDDLTEAMRKAGLKQTKGLVQAVKDYLSEKVADATEMIRHRNDLASDAFLNFRQSTLDQFTGIDNAVRRDVGNLPIEQDPYIAARLANGGTSAVMRGLLMHGKAQWAANGQHLEKVEGSKGLLQILEPLGDDMNNWFGWMVGNRASRLMADGRENNFTPKEIKALQALGGEPGSDKRALFNNVALQYADFKRSVLDVAQQAGLIDASARKVWDHADYIPFYRQIDERAAFSPTGRKGLAGQSSGIRTLKGGSAALNDPMENLLMNFSRLIDASLKNNALRKTVDALSGVDSEAITKVGYDMKAATVPRSEIEKALEHSGVPEQIMAILPPELFDGMAKMWAIQAPADKDVIRVMRGGKPEFYRVNDPLLLRAATSFVPLDFPGLAAARWFKRTLTQAITSTPEFMVRNFIRDSLASQMISRDRFSPAAALKGIKDSYKGTGASEAMLFAGASFQSGNVDAADPTATARSMRRALRARGMDASSIESFMATVVDKGLRGWERYRELGEALENANREAAYEASAKAEKSTTTAAYEAKDLMDFTLRGSSPLYQVMADTLPFFNARVQGLYRLGRAEPKRLARYGAVMLAASLALAVANAGEDWYEELPDWDKDTYWHIKLGGKHFRIPKPFELGVAFATIPERLLRSAMGMDSGNKTLSRLWANVRDQLAMDVVPQIIRPGLNVWANKDTFRDSPIETPTDEGKLPSLRYDGRTSATMKALTGAAPDLADAVGASPKRLEYLVNGYFGTVGAYALGLSDLAVRNLSDAPPSPAPRADDLPVVKSFYRMDPARGTVYESDLYKMREEVDAIYRSVNALRKEGDEDRADSLEADNIDKLAAREVIGGATKRLSELNKRRNAIYADRDMTPKEKREALDEIQVERNQVAKDAMTNGAVTAADR